MKVALAAGWGQEHDGVADYTRHFSDGLAVCGVETYPVTLKQYEGDPGFYVQAAQEAKGSDICHVQFNYVYFNGMLPYRNRFSVFARVLSVPLIMTVHEVRDTFETPESLVALPFRQKLFYRTVKVWNHWLQGLHRDIYNAARALIVHTKTHERLVRKYVHDSSRVVCIPHGIPACRPSGLAPDQAKKALGLEGKRILTIVGFINQRKGYETALDCLPSLPSDVILLIAGGPMTQQPVDNQYYKDLMTRIKHLRLESRVRITGYLSLESVADVFSATDICLAPFQSESASGALSLCIGYHKPIVASDIAAHREINDRVSCLQLYANGDAEDLCKKIGDLLQGGKRRSELESLCRSYAAHYSYAHIARQTITVYERFLD